MLLDLVVAGNSRYRFRVQTGNRAARYRHVLLMIAGVVCALTVVTLMVIAAIAAFNDLSEWEGFTGLSISNGASNVHTYDDAEFSAVAHVTLSAETLSRVLPRFERVTPGTRSTRFATPEKLPHVEELPEAWRALAPGAELYEAGECKGGYNWYALLDRSSRSLWIRLMYTDPSGMPPGCHSRPGEVLLEAERDAVERRLRERSK